MQNRIVVGLAPCRRLKLVPDSPYFSLDVARNIKNGLLSRIRADFGGNGVDFVDLEGVVEDGMMFDPAGAPAIAEHFRRAGADALFIINCNFGAEDVAGLTAKLSTRYLAPPTRIILTFIDKLTNPNPDGSTLPVNILVSLQVSLSGFLLAIAVGIPMGLLMGWYKGFDRFMRPVFELLRPIPPVAWIPLTIIWLGIGLWAKAFIIFFSAFIPCVINSYTGIRMTNQTFINVAKTFGATNFRMFLRVGLPSSLPMVFAGVRIALSNSWSTLVAAEMLAANAGLGYMILMGRQFVRPDIIILGMMVIGVVLTYALAWVEDRLVGWRAGR